MREEKYYYLRDVENKPIITVCLMKEGDNIARGMAFCSEKDQPCKAKGRAIAKNRAIHALHSKMSSLKVRRVKLSGLIYFFSYLLPCYKSSTLSTLTEQEKNFFEKSRQGDK